MSAVGGVFAVAGSLLVLVAAVGLHRFDGVMARLHAAGKATTLGIVAVLGGTALARLDAGSPRLLVAAVLYLVTVAAAVSLLARSVHLSEHARHQRSP